MPRLRAKCHCEQGRTSSVPPPQSRPHFPPRALGPPPDPLSPPRNSAAPGPRSGLGFVPDAATPALGYPRPGSAALTRPGPASTANDFSKRCIYAESHKGAVPLMSRAAGERPTRFFVDGCPQKSRRSQKRSCKVTTVPRVRTSFRCPHPCPRSEPEEDRGPQGRGLTRDTGHGAPGGVTAARSTAGCGGQEPPGTSKHFKPSDVKPRVVDLPCSSPPRDFGPSGAGRLGLEREERTLSASSFSSLPVTGGSREVPVSLCGGQRRTDPGSQAPRGWCYR